MIFFVISFIWAAIPVLINVAFFTLLERKILGLTQLRKGPNKVSWGGLLQPFSDAVKLFSKEMVLPYKSSALIFLFSPCLALSIILCLWSTFPLESGQMSHSYSVFVLMIFLAMNIYPLFFSGWASCSKYALMGATRGIAQSVSYEISLSIILLSFLVFSRSLELGHVLFSFYLFSYLILLSPGVGFWVVCCVAESNRSPFDFAEGESELVSGFNIEYSSSGFALLFMAEYGSILFLSFVSGLLILSSSFRAKPLFSVLLMLVWGGFWVWLRCTYPRYRYDKLMGLAWKSILPISLFICMFSLSVVI